MCIVFIKFMKFGRMRTCPQQGQCSVAAGFETDVVIQIVHMTSF